MLSGTLNFVFTIFVIAVPFVWLGANWLNHLHKHELVRRMEVLAAIKFAAKSDCSALELGRVLERLLALKSGGSIRQLSGELERYIYAPPDDISRKSLEELIDRRLSSLDKAIYRLVWAQPLGEERLKERGIMRQATLYGVSILLYYGAQLISRSWLGCQELMHLLDLNQDVVQPNVSRLLKILSTIESVQEIAFAIILALVVGLILAGWLGLRSKKRISWGLVLAMLHLSLNIVWNAPRFFDPLIVVQSVNQEGLSIVGTRGAMLPLWNTRGRRLVWIRGRDNADAAISWVQKKDYVGLYEYSNQCQENGRLEGIIVDK